MGRQGSNNVATYAPVPQSDKFYTAPQYSSTADTPEARPSEHSQAEESRPADDLAGLGRIFSGQPALTSLMVFIPLGFMADHLEWPASYIFGFNFLAIIPLAWLIGKSTEDLAASVGQTLGGLLNATFGNVVEMLLCIAGIRDGEIQVVQCTLLGSILSNLLLVLGTAFLVGGIYYKTQTYSQSAAAIQCSLMAMSIFAIGLPTLYAVLLQDADAGWEHMVGVSRFTSVFLLFTYVAYLYFQLGTHRSMFEEEGDDDEEEQPDLSPVAAAILLGIMTVTTTFSTDYLMHAIKGTVESWNVSKEFIGIIMLPIIGNAAEHYTAITVAARNKMDLSLGVAVGSSCQMALLVTPFTVIVGWVYGVEMTLDFHSFQLAVLFFAVFMANSILNNGQSNWLEGLMLLVTYFILAIIYFFEGSGKDSSLTNIA